MNLIRARPVKKASPTTMYWIAPSTCLQVIHVSNIEPKVIFYEREESLASDHMMEEISKVFHNKSFEQKGGSHLSTEMSNEPGMQRGSSVLSLLTSGSETERRKRKTIAEEDSHYFVISLDKIRDYQDDRTTIMIKNIPNKYTVQMLQDLINQSHRNAYDFLYLPIDFKVLLI